MRPPPVSRVGVPGMELEQGFWGVAIMAYIECSAAMYLCPHLTTDQYVMVWWKSSLLSVQQ